MLKCRNVKEDAKRKEGEGETEEGNEWGERGGAGYTRIHKDARGSKEITRAKGDMKKGQSEGKSVGGSIYVST